MAIEHNSYRSRWTLGDSFRLSSSWCLDSDRVDSSCSDSPPDQDALDVPLDWTYLT